MLAAKSRAEIPVFPGRLAAGPRYSNHSPRMEATVPGDTRRLDLSSPRTNRPYDSGFLVESAQGCCITNQDSGTDRLGCVSQLPRLARREGGLSSRGRTAQ